MTSSRIEIFKQMLANDPGNTAVLFGLAKEYEKAGHDEKLIEILNRYLEVSDDEGNAFGMLARLTNERANEIKRARLISVASKPRSAMATPAWPKSIA